jgi:xylan 1,4-beta-xylosidase
VLTRDDQLDVRGVPNPGGVWAPSISDAHGRIWVVYTVVRSPDGQAKDLDTYLVSAPDRRGPWSRPVYLNSRGFDPSLFHDADGRSWLAQLRWDHRTGHPAFGGIELQEIDLEAGRLAGEPVVVLRHDTLVEGPNLYRVDGEYHLLLAEGGTGWNHGIRTARADHLHGPWRLDDRPLLTTRHVEPQPGRLHKAGHGELVLTPEDGWYLVHLASRPLATREGLRCVLGRETCIQRVHVNPDGWFRLTDDDVLPVERVPAPRPLATARPTPDAAPHAGGADSAPSWSSLRGPVRADWAVVEDDVVRLRGRQGLHSVFEPSVLACPMTEPGLEARARVCMPSDDPGQRAGLVAYYDTESHAFLYVGTDDEGRPVVGTEVCWSGGGSDSDDPEVDVSGWAAVHLRLTVERATLRFAASPDGVAWTPVGQAHDVGFLSDDHGPRLRFTGTMVGLCAQDLSSRSTWATFDHIVVAPSRDPGRGDWVAGSDAAVVASAPPNPSFGMPRASAP